MVGSAICRQLSLRDDIELVVKTHKELDLTVQKDVDAFFEQEKIDQVYLAAAKVWWHLCQQYISGRIHLSESHD